MAGSRVLLVLLFVLSFSETGGGESSVTVGEGEDVTLSCANLIHQSQCIYTTWNFVKHSNSVEFYAHGQKKNEAGPGVSLSADCSLVLERVTVKEAGAYTCQQFIGDVKMNKTVKHGGDARVDLSVVTLTEQTHSGSVTFSCSVSTTYEPCRHKVKWLNNDEEVKQSSSPGPVCGASVTFDDPAQFYQTLKCEVSDESQKKFTYSLRSSDDSTTTRKPTSPQQTETGLEVLVVVPVVLSALVAAAVVFIVWRRKRRPRADGDTNKGVELRAAAAENSQDSVNPEASVTYASICPVASTNSRHPPSRDTDDSVTYSSVRVCSPAAADSDPSPLYATVNKPPTQEPGL